MKDESKNPTKNLLEEELGLKVEVLEEAQFEQEFSTANKRSNGHISEKYKLLLEQIENLPPGGGIKLSNIDKKQALSIRSAMKRLNMLLSIKVRGNDLFIKRVQKLTGEV